MDQAGRSRRQRYAILQMLRLSKTPQQCLLKQAPRKNYLLLLDGSFSTSLVMGQAHEEDVEEAMRDGNTCLSSKRFGFLKKKRRELDHRLLSSLKVPGVQPGYCLERWMLFLRLKKKKKICKRTSFKNRA